MRKAFGEFNRYFREYNFPTIPPYGAVALMAATKVRGNANFGVAKDFFNIEPLRVNGSETKTQEVWTLKEKYRFPGMLSEAFGDLVLTGRLPRNVLLITGFGASGEAEDDVVALLTHRLRRAGIGVVLIFCDDRPYEEMENLYLRHSVEVGDSCADECVVSASQKPDVIKRIIGKNFKVS